MKTRKCVSLESPLHLSLKKLIDACKPPTLYNGFPIEHRPNDVDPVPFGKYLVCTKNEYKLPEL